VAKSLVVAFEVACDHTKGATAATAVYLGSELIVATMYSKLSAYFLVLADSDSNCMCTKSCKGDNNLGYTVSLMFYKNEL